MKNHVLFTILTGLTPLIHTRYFFNALVINELETKSYEYVHQNSRAEKHMPTKFIKSFDNLHPNDVDFCSLGATNNGAAAGTAAVSAGSELAMQLAVGAAMRYPGPAQVYMSKALGAVADDDGSGGWFKIHQGTTCNGGDVRTMAWCTWDKDRILFTIPRDTPHGEYLVTAEHIGLHGAHVNDTEFYYE